MPLIPPPPFEQTLADYFREQLLHSAEQLHQPPHEDTLWYMGNMLARFGDSEQLFSYDVAQVGIRPLALLYHDAREAVNPRERCLLLRQLGDLALFLGALFPENFSRRGIHKDYIVGMGGGAYDYLAENAPQNRHIFSELAATFVQLLELIARACNRRYLFDATDILKLYQRWRHSRDERIAGQLRALGVDLPQSIDVH